MVASMSGGAYFGYKYVTSEQFKTRVMNEILGNVQTMMPKVLEKGLPDLTGPSLPVRIRKLHGIVILSLFGVLMLDIEKSIFNPFYTKNTQWLVIFLVPNVIHM